MKEKKISNVILVMCILILGILLIIWADKITNIFSILLGILAIIYGIITFINYFKTKDKTFGNMLSFIYGIIILVMGFILVFRVDFLKELISFVVGIYIVLSSLFKLHEILVLQKDSNIKLTSSIVITIILVFLGILCICGKFLIPDIIIRFIGIILVIYSVMFILNMILLKHK